MLKGVKENGLYDFVNRIEKFNNSSELIQHIKLESDDIERSDVVKKIIEIYEDKKKINVLNETLINENTKNDAALIPIQHMTKYQDIFNDKINF